MGLLKGFFVFCVSGALALNLAQSSVDAQQCQSCEAALGAQGPLNTLNVKEIDGFVRVRDVDSSIVVDLRYATANNFTGKKVYPAGADAILRKETARKLAAANARFQADGYRIKIWDAYRPPSVQKTFWDIVHDDRYVANPYKGGSKHNRGGAVDITLVDSSGKEIEMPSAFDDFTEKASRGNLNMSPEARKNVNYLTSVMSQNGFVPYDDEWWHFDDQNWQQFPLLNVKFEQFSGNAGAADTPALPAVLKQLDKNVGQAVIVEPLWEGSFKATLTFWQTRKGKWEKILGPFEAVIGKNGLAKPNKKREGDGRTPSGIFSLSGTFGSEPTVATKAIFYRRVTENDFWVDDPSSPQYNTWVTGTPNAKSFERLKRDDGLYKYAIIVDYNATPIKKGKGSAIFVHVWRDADSPTAGCVALSEDNLKKLFEWIDWHFYPVVILGEPKR